MRRFLPILIFFTLLLYLVYLIDNNKKPKESTIPLPSEKQEKKEENYYDFNYEDFDLRASFITISGNSLKLIVNYEDSKPSDDVYVENNCIGLSSAGFYDEMGEPIGYVVNKGEILNQKIESSLFNGFVTLEGSMKITKDDLDSVGKNTDIVQTGPVLLYNKKSMDIKMNNDKYARRIVAAVKDTNTSYLMAIYNKNSLFQGPLLSDLPEILEDVSIAEDLDIVHAINLDGGSASAFFTEGLKLKELKKVGSFICVTK